MNSTDTDHYAGRHFWDRAVKCGISLLVFLFSKTWKTLALAFGQTPKGKCVVLYYHSVPASERLLFAEQLDMMLRWSGPIACTENATVVPGRHCIAITFDDGFENFLTQALPELEKRKIPATVFMIADGMNREFGSGTSAEKLLSLEQMQSLPEDLVTIGAHTLTHPMLTELGEAEARREIQESKTKLEAMLGRKVTQFSFPYGAFNQRLVALCREAGYERVYTTLPAFAFEHRGEFLIGRVRIDPTDWRLEVRLKVAGAYRWLPMAITLKRQIISMARCSMARPLVRPAAPRSMIR